VSKTAPTRASPCWKRVRTPSATVQCCYLFVLSGTPARLSVSGPSSPTHSIDSGSELTSPTSFDGNTLVTPRPHRRAPLPAGQPLKQRRHHASTPASSTIIHSRLSSLASDPHTPNSPGTPSIAPRPPSDVLDNALTPHLPPEIAALLNSGDLPPPPLPSEGELALPLPVAEDPSSSPSPVFPDHLPPPPSELLPRPTSTSTSPESQQSKLRSEAASSDDDLDWRPDEFV
jgi:hypothetical protein